MVLLTIYSSFRSIKWVLRTRDFKKSSRKREFPIAFKFSLDQIVMSDNNERDKKKGKSNY